MKHQQIFLLESRRGKIFFAMKKGLELKVRGESSRGTVTNDIYTLNGFTAAYNKLTEEC